MTTSAWKSGDVLEAEKFGLLHRSKASENTSEKFTILCFLKALALCGDAMARGDALHLEREAFLLLSTLVAVQTDTVNMFCDVLWPHLPRLGLIG